MAKIAKKKKTKSSERKTAAKDKKFDFSKKWDPTLEKEGFTMISSFFLKNYYRLKPYDLTYGEAMFVIHIMQYKWTEESPYPAFKTIAERMHVSTKSARRFAQSLDKKGYLIREIRKGYTNKFDLKPLINALVALKKKQDKESSKD